MLSTKFTKKEVEDISVVSEQNNIINLLTNVTIDTAFEFLQALEKSGKLNDSLREKILSERMNIVGRC